MANFQIGIRGEILGCAARGSASPRHGSGVGYFQA